VNSVSLAPCDASHHSRQKRERKRETLLPCRIWYELLPGYHLIPSLISTRTDTRNLLAVIVGTLDNPLYESILSSSKSSQPTPSTTTGTTSQSAFSLFSSPSLQYPIPSTNQPARHVLQLVAHASLDVVEDVMWTNGAMSVVPLSPVLLSY
jgi:hypothetical protein